MLQAAAAARSGLVSTISRCLTPRTKLLAPCQAASVAPFSSSTSNNSSVSEGSSNSPRPSSDDDRQDIDRYIHEHPPADGPVPTALEHEESRRAAAKEHIFSAGDESQGFTAAAAAVDADTPATESMTAPHTRHQSASTKDFGGDPTRIDKPDPESLKEGHAIPNEGATTH